jgi:mRNA interferase MazF
MVAAGWVPNRKDIIHLDDAGAEGHEQKGDRPHLVLTKQGYNDKTSLVVCVPITTKVKNNPFETPIADLNRQPSVALTHMIITADWRARNAFPRGTASDEEMADVEKKIKTLLTLG